MKIMIFFFCQFRGARFTSFFKTYNLTKYQCILCPFISIDKIVITSTVFKLHFFSNKGYFRNLHKSCEAEHGYYTITWKSKVSLFKSVKFVLSLSLKFRSVKNSSQKDNNLGSKIIVIESTLECCTSSKLTIE